MRTSTRTMAICATTLSLLLSGCGSSSNTVKGPAIVTQPATATIISGSNSVLSVLASGNTLTYQWYLDGAAIAGATAPTYTATSAGTYYVVVTATDGTVTSANAVMTLTSAPVLTAQPVSATILTGTSEALSVVASGANVAYQWYKDGAAIDGATHPSYVASVAGSYTVTATNAAGSVTSAAAVIAVSASVTAPVIGTQPVAQTVNGGTGATFSVGASGVSAAYQWYLNDTAIAGATRPSYRIGTANASSAGGIEYRRLGHQRRCGADGEFDQRRRQYAGRGQCRHRVPGHADG